MKSCNWHDYSSLNAENFVTEVQEAIDNLPINQSNPCETLDSGFVMLEQCLNEQAPIKKLPNAKQKLSHKLWITPCLLKSIKTKNRLHRALVRSGFSSQKANAKYKSTGIKLLIYWKSTKETIISHNFCLVEMILGKCGSSLIPLLVPKKKVRALQRNYLTLSNQTTVHKQSRSHVQYIQHLLCLNRTAISKQDSSPSSQYISSKS